MYWMLGIAIAFVAFLLIEGLRVRRARRSVPLRIVVTGTRGKSSFVRILAAGLRADSPGVWGKITGDAPLLLEADGTSKTILRRGPARVHEQRRILLDAARRGIRDLVLESMAISPEAMRAEMRLIRPSLVVITNVYDDHRETLGADRNAQREAYLSALPAGTRWLTADPVLADYAARDERIPPPLTSPFARSLGPEDEESPTDVAHDLLALADTVLADLGRDTPAAREAMRAAAADIVLPPRVVPFLDRRVSLLDAFSANDLQSLERLWRSWRRLLDDTSPWSVLLTTRADRPLRTQQFCGWLADRTDVGTVYVAGSHQAVAAWLLRRRGVTVRLVAEDGRGRGAAPAPGAGPAESSPEILVGVGNARGLGLQYRELAQAADA